MNELLGLALRPLAFIPAPWRWSDRVHWVYLLGAAAVAFVGYARARSLGAPHGFLRFLFPRNVWFSKSSRLDVVFVLFVRSVCAALMAPLFLLIQRGARTGAVSVLQMVGLAAEGPRVSSPLGVVVCTFVSLLAIDFGLFISHYAMHRIPALWEFHKVHHSADTLTPLTVYRMHPIDDLVCVSTVAALEGAALGVFEALRPGVAPMMIAGLNAGLFAFYVAGYNLRHSHVWVSYGPIVERFLSSPAQHQIHHSDAVEHANKNLGFMFSFWDWIFGSLVTASGSPSIRFGISPDENARFRTLGGLTLLPFRRGALALWRGRRQ